MIIEIKDGDEYENALHALKMAIVYVNNNLRSGVEGSHPERRSTTWWVNYMNDVKIAKTLSLLLDKLEKIEDSGK